MKRHDHRNSDSRYGKRYRRDDSHLPRWYPRRLSSDPPRQLSNFGSWKVGPRYNVDFTSNDFIQSPLFSTFESGGPVGGPWARPLDARPPRGMQSEKTDSVRPPSQPGQSRRPEADRRPRPRPRPRPRDQDKRSDERSNTHRPTNSEQQRPAAIERKTHRDCSTATASTGIAPKDHDEAEVSSEGKDDIKIVMEYQSEHQVYPDFHVEDDLGPCGNRVLCFSRWPERFVDLSTERLDGSSGRSLENDIWQHYIYRRQSKALFQKKVAIWVGLNAELRRRLDCRTLVFGSTLSGFGSNSSDMDLCVFSDYLSQGPCRGNVEFLTTVKKLLRSNCQSFISRDIVLIPAKVPVLKLSNRSGDLQIDVTCNSRHGSLNSHLLFCYSQLDSRVRPLVLAVKAWAANQGINDASRCTMSSYTLTLMVLNFLQCGVTPPLLPSLHLMYPRVFTPDSDIFRLPYLNRLPEYVSRNKQGLGELLIEFFRHYTHRVDFSNDVMSVRQGRILANRECEHFATDNGLQRGQWAAYICVEEPFDRTNAARAVVKRDKFDVILRSLKQADETLTKENASLTDLVGW